MILAPLAQANDYAALHPHFAAAFAFLRRTDLAQLPDGRQEIAGDDVYAMVSRYTPKPPADDLRWEAHRRYIDVQYAVAGSELIGWSPLAVVRETVAYDAAGDCAFYSGPGCRLPLAAGRFAIFFPADAHAPGLADGSGAAMLKIVVKVRCQ
ncbi:MAG TPA: YhcH/YjgK/YiaL family protein [bacterium]|nr:YhcH/YjgK/YiaL family protein [bacterium]